MYIQLISIHGLVRGENVEMGRDADTGGQVRYVLDLARALAQMEGVDQVDLFTRRLRDKRLSPDYSNPIEPLGDKCRLVRLPCGGGKHFRKERLWPYLDEFIDRLIAFTRSEGRVPAFVHGHYADAGYVARHAASVFGVPFIFSGHSLGRPKKAYLLEQGRTEDFIEREYHIARRIEEEENCLAEASLVITSTHYERDVNYGMYQRAATPKYEIIPPGVDLSRYFPYYNYELPGEEIDEVYKQARVRMTRELGRFHFQSEKPLILAVCRPERRKNIGMLVECYGSDKGLQAMANLAIFAGIRKDIEQMNPDEQEVLTEMLKLMDRYDLYGKMAVPKQHASETDVPELYRIAASHGGIFVSTAYVENFGLTFIESSAAGLPFIGTDKGGPVDILENTGGGLLIDLSDPAHLTEAMRRLLSDPVLWRGLSDSGINRTRQSYSWPVHCEHYLRVVRKICDEAPALPDVVPSESPAIGRRLASVERLFITDIDDTLLGDEEAFARFAAFWSESREKIAFGVATGRSIESATETLDALGLNALDIYITSVGAEIRCGPQRALDKGWQRHISHRWRPERVHEALDALPFLNLQTDPHTQREFKISYDIDRDAIEPEEALRLIHAALDEAQASCNVIHSHGVFIDVLPYRASKGKAIRFLSDKWGIPPKRILAAGNSGNDADMLLGRVCGIVVGNHDEDLESLRDADRVYFAEASHADGILEGFRHYHVRNESVGAEA